MARHRRRHASWPRDGNQQRGPPPRHRACHQRAVHWPALENGPPRPMASRAVASACERASRGRSCRVPSLPESAARLAHLDSRATTPGGWYQLGDVPVLRLGDAGRGTAGYGIAWGGTGGTASQPARRCPRPRGPRAQQCRARLNQFLHLCAAPFWQATWVSELAPGVPTMRSQLHGGAVDNGSVVDGGVDAGSGLGAQSFATE